MDQDEWLQGTLRYAGKAQDKVSVDTLMLRYRPIAPKPTTGNPCAAGDNNNNSMSKRTKRKYVKVSKNNKSTCRGKSRSDLSDDREQSRAVTLQLLPEKADLSGEYTPLDQDSLDPTVKTIIGEKTRETNAWGTFNGGATVEVETWVTVESVTGVCDGSSSSHAVECTDAEMVDNLGKDTCPAFVSDGSNRVVWVNEAYRRNVSGEDSSSSLPDVVVWLVAEESTVAMYCNYRAFTCRVRMQYTWQETKYTKTVPCDVWKMEFGGFAWRLDTTAALTLWL
ncbi:hypothetical protein EUTSA_v10004746mg [Eutrema salsugineum]|uniref:DUF7950 domain-containing protein n=1 Tax=Eutrema salsugineum TaxID=72664 RepID=V4MMJ8_EUTSA|nr:uncharacterized protein LOC18012139 [Eutrema salsugineum]ESQ32751.1 hypothetical protein EUTSA_v10004746mg [Eutrema salsugineum]